MELDTGDNKRRKQFKIELSVNITNDKLNKNIFFPAKNDEDKEEA